ncbi:MAG: hypothetical protein ACOVQ7_04330 [Limnoraphis robusta]|jgi:hypothetical protein
MPDFDNEDNWTNIYQNSASFSGVPNKNNHLPTQFINIPIQSNFFKINAVSSTAKSQWWLAGRLTLFIGGAIDPNRTRTNSYIIPLKFWQFAQFEILPENVYHLQFEAAWWLQDIQIEVKQYFEI